MHNKLRDHGEIDSKGPWRLAELREYERCQDSMKERDRAPGRLRQEVTGPKVIQVPELTKFRVRQPQ